MKTIEIKEDFRLPGTDIILEIGDKIQIKESKLQEAYSIGNLLLPPQIVGHQGRFPGGELIPNSVAVAENVVLQKDRGNQYVLYIGNIANNNTLEVYLNKSTIQNIAKSL